MDLQLWNSYKILIMKPLIRTLASGYGTCDNEIFAVKAAIPELIYLYLYVSCTDVSPVNSTSCCLDNENSSTNVGAFFHFAGGKKDVWNIKEMNYQDDLERLKK